LKTIVPLEVFNGRFSFILFAIWANHPADKGFQYVGQIWKALDHYKAILKNNKIVLIGDFNSNTIWDKPKRLGNHSTVVNHLKELDIHSCYHQHFNSEQGKEKHYTLYMYRNKDKGYHIDYCFASRFFIDCLKTVTIGKHKEWSRYSDHTPLIIDFDL
jgi:exonuclease III